MNGKPFTEFEDEQLRRLHECGATVRHMSMVLNRPYGSICTRRQHLGLSYRDGEGRGPSKRQDEAVNEYVPPARKDCALVSAYTAGVGLLVALVATAFVGVFWG